MKLSKIKIALVIPVLSYIIFMLNLYSNINVASAAFFAMVISTIVITLIAFNQGEKNVKENQRA